MSSPQTAPVRAGERQSAAQTVKFALDRVIGVVGSAFTLLVTPFVALAIKAEDRGPVFHRREFVNCDGTLRYYLKFRTMVCDADAVLSSRPDLKHKYALKHKLEEDPRVLRCGRFLRKFSIDEFPQFFSLLTGELTFVGPRVISREEMDRYGDFLPRLLSVKPGITGYWQVNGRQNTTYQQRIQMDMYYVENWSLWLDMKIIAKTFLTVLSAEGAH